MNQDWEVTITKCDGHYYASFLYDPKVKDYVKKYGYGRWDGDSWVLPPSGVRAFMRAFKGRVSCEDFDMETLEKDIDNEVDEDLIFIKRCDEGYCAKFDYDTDYIYAVKKYGHGRWQPDSRKKYWVLTPEGILSLLKNYDTYCHIDDELLSEVKKIVEDKEDLKKKQEEKDAENEK